MMKNFLENIDDLFLVNCAISDYYIEFTLNNLSSDEKSRNFQLDLLIPMFKKHRIDSEKYHFEGKLKKMQAIYKDIEQEASEDILMEQFVFDKTGVKLGMYERHNQKLRKVINRGKLKNENEYHMIMDQINILCQLSEKNDELIDDLNRLISDFEKENT